MSNDALIGALPSLILVAVAMGVFLGGTFKTPRYTWVAVSVLGIGGALLAQFGRYFSLLWPEGSGKPIASVQVLGPIAVDLMGEFLGLASLLIGLIYVLGSWQAGPEEHAPTRLGCALLITAGLGLIGSAQEMVLLFVALELISIPTYVLLYVGRWRIDAQESAVKYFFLSMLSSALLLYGLSFLYGVSGSTDLVRVRQVLSGALPGAGENGFLLKLSLLLIVAGLGFKLACVPFHFYAPDVYQGTTHANVALLSTAPKFAGAVAMIRLAIVAMPGIELTGWRTTLILAMFTMSLGNLVALWQQDVRRLLAYSSIAHGGYLLIGLSVGFATQGTRDMQAPFDGVGSVLFYLLGYALAGLGTFSVLAYLSSGDREVMTVDDLAGVGWSHPLLGIALAIFLFSLAGIPPLAGFWGKFALFGGALSVDRAGEMSSIRGWFVALAIVGVLNAAIAAAYYLRILVVAYFHAPRQQRKISREPGSALACGICAVFVLGIGLFPRPFLQGATAASRAARQPETAAGQHQTIAGQPGGIAGQPDNSVDEPLAIPSRRSADSHLD